MLKGFKYRLYPTDAQAELINKHIGSCRFVYNLALECKQMAYAGSKVNLTCFDLIKQLPDLKKECEWLKEVNSQSLQQSIVNLDVAYNSFFKGRMDFPNFKKKGYNQSFHVPQNVLIVGNKLIIPKFKKGIEIVLHREYTGTIRQATISKTPTGKYFVSLLIETSDTIPAKAPITESSTIGIDLGIKTFIVGSNGEAFDNPKFLRKTISKLKYIQCKYSKYRGKRTRKELALLYELVANQRKDFLHKTSTRLIRENQSIVIEDLNIKGMTARCKPVQDETGRYLPNGQSRKSGLNRAITDASWGMLVTMLEYKAEWYGRNILRIGRFDPSSKTCHACGSINKKLTLEDREWTCRCGVVLDRDVNAAINIKTFALKKHLSAEHRLENRNELPTLVGVLTSEAPIPLG